MAALDPIQLDRFVQIFPELPAKDASLLLTYTLGMPCGGEARRRRINRCRELLGLNSLHELRCVVLARLLLN
jgi:hypothetical protein